LLFDRTRARKERCKPIWKCSGINPSASLDNGWDELAFPAPERELVIHVEGFHRPKCHRLPREGSFLPVSNDQEFGGERSRSVMRIKVAPVEQTNRKPSYTSESVVTDLEVNTVGQSKDRKLLL